MIVAGVDPGFSGGFALLDGDGHVLRLDDLPVEHVPNTSGKMRGRYVEPRLRAMLDYGPCTIAFVERQQSMPDQSAQSTFATGQGFGLIRGILVGLNVPYELVSAVTWKSVMLAGLGRDKSHALEKARALFPTADLGKRKDAGRAEALLLAEYGRRLILGRTAQPGLGLTSRS